MGKSLKEVEKRFPDGLPALDPIEDMKIRDSKFEEIVRKIETLEHRLYKHCLHNAPNLNEIYELYEKKNELAIKCKDTKQELRDARTGKMCSSLLISIHLSFLLSLVVSLPRP